MIPVRMMGVTNATKAVIDANIDATLKRGYTAFVPAMMRRKKISVVGAGPSLAWTHKRISGDIIACNSGHDYLIGKGVIPRYALFWDANPVIADIFKPHHGITYFVASRCHESVFEKLRGYDVVVWHALGDDNIVEKVTATGRNESLIAGGTTSVSRGLFIAGSLGYQEMHVFGMDSSYAEGRTHVAEGPEGQGRARISACGREFDVAPWMILQAEDFKIIAKVITSNGAKLVVHGTGLIPYTASFCGCITPDIKVGRVEKLRRIIHSALSLYHSLRNLPQLLGDANARI